MKVSDEEVLEIAKQVANQAKAHRECGLSVSADLLDEGAKLILVIPKLREELQRTSIQVFIGLGLKRFGHHTH